MKSHVFATLIALSLVFLPAASATSITGQMTVESAELHEVAGTADLALLKFLSGNGTLPASFHVQAESLRLELDQTAYSAVVDSERVDYDYTTTPSNHAQAVIASDPAGPKARWALESAPGREPPRVAVYSACVGVDPAPYGVAISATVVNRGERPDRSTSVADALRLRPCAETTLTITGDFLLSIWDWDFRLNADDGGRVIETGVHPRSDGLGDQATEAYLYARNATLTTSIASDPAAFFAKDATLDAAAARLSNARGGLDLGGQGLTLAGDELDLQGDLRLDLDGTDAQTPYRVSIDGTTAHARSDGQPLTIQAPAAPVGTPLALFWLLGVAIVAAGFAVRVRPLVHDGRNARHGLDIGSILPQSRRERRGRGYWVLAQRAFAAKRPRRALHYAKRAYALFPMLPETHLMLAKALVSRGRDTEALPHFLAASGILTDPDKRAEANFGAAVTNLHLGFPDAAMDRMFNVLDLAPDWAAEHLDLSLFESLQGNPRYPELRVRFKALASPWESFEPDAA